MDLVHVRALVSHDEFISVQERAGNAGPCGQSLYRMTVHGMFYKLGRGLWFGLKS